MSLKKKQVVGGKMKQMCSELRSAGIPWNYNQAANNGIEYYFYKPLDVCWLHWAVLWAFPLIME